MSLASSILRIPGGLGKQAVFGDLLKAGGQGVWRLTPDNRSAIALANFKGIAITQSRRGLLIQITEPEFIHAFLEEKPAGVLFIERGSQLAARPRQTEVAVRDVVTSAAEPGESAEPNQPGR